MKQSDVPTLDLHKLEQSPRGPIWVFNNTSGDNRSDILFSSARLNGTKIDTVRVPTSFLPIDLTKQVPRKQVLEGAEFRRAISRNLLRLVSSVDVVGYMESLDKEDVDLELERIHNLEASGAIEGQTSSIGQETAEAIVKSGMGIGDVNSAVVSLMAGLTEKDSQTPLIGTLRTMAESLVDKDWKYIIMEGQKLRLKKLVMYANRELKQLTGS